MFVLVMMVSLLVQVVLIDGGGIEMQCNVYMIATGVSVVRLIILAFSLYFFLDVFAPLLVLFVACDSFFFVTFFLDVCACF